MVVLQELAERYQDFSYIDDLIDLSCNALCRSDIIGPEDIPVCEPYGRPLNRIDRNDPGRFPGPLHLHLGSDSEKIAEKVHRCRVQASRCKSRIARPAVPEPEPTLVASV
jgi:hypothetical protein